MAKGTAWETIRGQGGQVVDEVKRLIHEGNVRRVVVRQKDRVVAEFPLTVGVVGALAAPAVAAIGAWWPSSRTAGSTSSARCSLRPRPARPEAGARRAGRRRRGPAGGRGRGDAGPVTGARDAR